MGERSASRGYRRFIKNERGGCDGEHPPCPLASGPHRACARPRSNRGPVASDGRATSKPKRYEYV